MSDGHDEAHPVGGRAVNLNQVPQWQRDQWDTLFSIGEAMKSSGRATTWNLDAGINQFYLTVGSMDANDRPSAGAGH